jgi:glucosylceramidase
VDGQQYYAIVGVESGKALDVRGGPSAVAVHAAIQQWDFAGADNQVWRLEPTGDGSFEIFSKDTDLLLDVPWGSMDNSTPIQLYPAAGGDNERWSLISTGEGSFVILGKNSGKCLNVASGSVDNGAGIVQYDCANAANQKWYLIPLGEPAPSDGN